MLARIDHINKISFGDVLLTFSAKKLPVQHQFIG